MPEDGRFSRRRLLAGAAMAAGMLATDRAFGHHKRSHVPRNLNIGIGSDVSDLPLVAWEGGPAYWTVAQSGAQMGKAEANGWSDNTFFPIAVWLSDPAHADELAALGINTYLGIFANTGAINTAAAAGVSIIPQANEWTASEVTAETTGRDSVVGWLPRDEPELNVSFSTYMSEVSAVNARDTDRFILTNFCHGIRRTVFYDDATSGGTSTEINDAACADQYCYTSPGIRGELGPQGIADNANYPSLHGGTSYLWPGAYQDGAAVEQAAAYGWQAKALKSLYTDKGHQRPVWVAVETQMPYLTDTGRDIILYAEIQGAVWSALVNEARGILWFQHNGFYTADELGPGNPATSYVGNDPNTGAAPDTSSMSLVDGPAGLISYVAGVNQDILDLAPVLNTQSRVWNYSASGIETMTKIHGGYLYIFATKSVLGTTGAKTFTLPSGVSGTSVEVLVGGGGPHAVSGGQFSRTWTNEYDVLVGRVTI
jgi:hypothetical protein